MTFLPSRSSPTSADVVSSERIAQATLFRRLPHPAVANDARSGRVLMTEHQVTSLLCGCNSYSRDFASQARNDNKRDPTPDAIASDAGHKPLTRCVG